MFWKKEEENTSYLQDSKDLKELQEVCREFNNRYLDYDYWMPYDGVFKVKDLKYAFSQVIKDQKNWNTLQEQEKLIKKNNDILQNIKDSQRIQKDYLQELNKRVYEEECKAYVKIAAKIKAGKHE